MHTEGYANTLPLAAHAQGEHAVKERTSTVRKTCLVTGRDAGWHPSLTRTSPFKYFKTSSEIVRLAGMLNVCFQLSLQDADDL